MIFSGRGIFTAQCAEISHSSPKKKHNVEVSGPARLFAQVRSTGGLRVLPSALKKYVDVFDWFIKILGGKCF